MSIEQTSKTEANCKINNYFSDLIIKLQSANEEEWIVTNIFIRFFENSSDELGTGNTRHFRKSIVNDESDER